MPRKRRLQEVDLDSCRVYHVVSKCVRSMRLLGADEAGNYPCKTLCLRELERVAEVMAVEVAGFAVMDNHVHLLLKVKVEEALRWSPREVATRWLRLHPPRDGAYRPVEVTQEIIALHAANDAWVEATRQKLYSLSQFMKEFKQEVAQRANKLLGVTGLFWEGRFKLRRVTSEGQLLATLCYIDLNPFAAGVCEMPEDGRFTSMASRLGRDTDDVLPPQMEEHGCTSHPGMPRQPAPKRWLSPLSARSGLLLGLTEKHYLSLLDQTARLLRPGKRRLAKDTEPISKRLAVSPVGLAAAIRELADDWVRTCGVLA